MYFFWNDEYFYEQKQGVYDILMCSMNMDAGRHEHGAMHKQC